MSVDVAEIEAQCGADVLKLDLTKKGSVQIKSFLFTRKRTRRSILEMVDEIDAKARPFSLGYVNACLSKISTATANLSKLNDEIDNYMVPKMLWDDDEIDGELRVSSWFNDLLVLKCEELKIEQMTLSAQSGLPQQPPPGQLHQKVPLQNIPLPTFDGSHAKYHKFIDQFEKVLAKYNLSEFEKFSYLVKSVNEGPARQLMEIVEASTMDYPTAKRLLDRAYPLGHVQQDSIIKDIVKLKFDPKEPFKWISSAEVFNLQLTATKVTGETFLQYFLWNSLNDTYRQKLSEITQKSRPSVKEICDSFFDARMRVGDMEEFQRDAETQNPMSTLTLSSKASVKAKDKKNGQRATKCVLCEQGHKTVQCTKFATPSSKQKRLKELNRCINCMLGNHSSQDCRYRFQSKCACGGSHYQFLCVSKQKKPPAETPKTPEPEGSSVSTASKSVIIALPSQSVAEGTILPSFTASVFGSDGSIYDCRSFCDTCNQTTLIETDFARKLKLKSVEKNIDLVLKGINSDRHIKSETVELDIKVGRETHRIIALCVPEVNVDLEVGDLDTLLEEFRKQNYSIADKSLNGSKLSGAKLLLGSDHTNILLTGVGRFGEEGKTKSIFFRTPIGVMFVGRIEKMIHDVQYLPSESESSL